MHGRPLTDIFHYLLRKYCRFTEAIERGTADFLNANLDPGQPFAAVHLRGTDKIAETDQLDEINRAIIETVVDEIDPTWPILVLTDDVRLLAKARRDLASRKVFATDSIRGNSNAGTHLNRQLGGALLGRQAMIDTNLAVKATRFLGNAKSNLSAVVPFLTDWPPGSCKLFGGKLIVIDRNWYPLVMPNHRGATSGTRSATPLIIAKSGGRPVRAPLALREPSIQGPCGVATGLHFAKLDPAYAGPTGEERRDGFADWSGCVCRAGNNAGMVPDNRW